MEDWTLLGQHKRKPEFPVITRESRSDSKNLVVPPSSQDEALARYSVSREVSHSVLKFETLLGTLDVTPKVPRHTGLNGGEHGVSRQHFN